MNLFKIYSIGILILCSASALWADNAPDAPAKDSLYMNVGYNANATYAYYGSNQNTTGFNVGIGYGFRLSRLFQLVIDANADIFPLDGNTVSHLGLTGGDQVVGTLLANLRYRFLAQDNPLVPYLIGGMGPAFVSQITPDNNGNFDNPGAPTLNFAFRLGVGVDIRLSEMTSLFVEADYYLIPGTNSDTNLNGAMNVAYDSIRLGGKFNL
jgi:outer membrane autotransporter protein